MPMQYTAKFYGFINDNFSDAEKSDIFLIFAYYIYYGYTYNRLYACVRITMIIVSNDIYARHIYLSDINTRKLGISWIWDTLFQH